MPDYPILEHSEQLFKANRWNDLIELFEKQPISGPPELLEKEQNGFLFWTATAYARLGKLPRAWKLIKKLLESCPDDLGVLHLAALVTCGMAEYDQTILYASRYFEKLSFNQYSQKFGLGENLKHEVYGFWGIALKQLGGLEEAAEKFKKAIEAKGDEPAGYLNLVHLYLQKGKFPEAGSILAEGLKKLSEPEELYKAAEVFCPNPQAATVYLKALSSAGKWPEMLKVLSKNSSLEHYHWAKKFKAQALAGLEAWGEARHYYEEYIASADGDWEALNELGNVCFHLGYFDRAEECYRQALETNPAWEQGWRNLSVSLTKLGKIKEARTSLEQYVSRVPEDKAVYGLLADLLYQEKEFGRAINFYEDYLRFHPAEKESWLKLADCYFNLGHPQSALVGYEQAQNLAPESNEIRAKIDSLKRQYPLKG